MNASTPGVGPTAELSLRVSVASLCRVELTHPHDGAEMLALEHKATLITGQPGSRVEVQAQPFGGAVRIRDLKRLQDLAGPFNYDSQRTRTEQDFRIYVRPTAWEALRAYCLRSLEQEEDAELDFNPVRELEEEFYDTLGIRLTADQYSIVPVRTRVENEAGPSSNIHARGRSTTRIYRIFAVRILDPDLAVRIIRNSEKYSGRDLERMAMAEAQHGGRGRANAILAAALDELQAVYRGIPAAERALLIPYQDTFLAGNVRTVLPGIASD